MHNELLFNATASYPQNLALAPSLIAMMATGCGGATKKNKDTDSVTSSPSPGTGGRASSFSTSGQLPLGALGLAARNPACSWSKWMQCCTDDVILGVISEQISDAVTQRPHAGVSNKTLGNGHICVLDSQLWSPATHSATPLWPHLLDADCLEPAIEKPW